MNEDSIFITVNVEQYLLRSKRKILSRTYVYTVIFLRTYVLEREKRRKCTANAALIVHPLL